VEVFDLLGSASMTICYAWLYIDGEGQIKHVMVPGSHLIDSPQKAVSAAIFVDAMPPSIPTARKTDETFLFQRN
jgi:hypothetical protein